MKDIFQLVKEIHNDPFAVTMYDSLRTILHEHCKRVWNNDTCLWAFSAAFDAAQLPSLKQRTAPCFHSLTLQPSATEKTVPSCTSAAPTVPSLMTFCGV
jgi:hypothetical protein